MKKMIILQKTAKYYLNFYLKGRNIQYEIHNLQGNPEK